MLVGCWCAATAGNGELAFHRCCSPEPVPLRELVRVAGSRWTVEESFQAGKGLAGLDELLGTQQVEVVCGDLVWG